MLIYDPNKIIELRKERGLNQSELARRAGLSAPTVWALEKGETVEVKFETLSAVAAALGVPVQALLSADQPSNMDAELVAVSGSLTPGNKAALLAAAHALLKSQGPH